MELLSCPAPVVIQDSHLTGWEVKGSGGFGQVYKARHQQWCCDVAIKVLHYDNGTSQALLRELAMMRQGANPYVIHVHGIFQGRLPSSGPTTQLGLVMEFMERGCLTNLQKTLQGPPPWPLAFRLTHQVALGINFLHSLSPAVLHLDLKPSNVLLDFNLNAKLTDFGLARFSSSVTRVSKKDSEEEGGTLSYMPPEAFEVSYDPTRASDIYSYGILLWSIVTGKQPYANARSTIVRLRIPQGDRPSLDEIRCQAAGVAGLTTLINLMQRCWHTNPNQRPCSRECTTETEELHKLHKHTIHDAVHQVLKKLDQYEEEIISEQTTRISISESDVVAAVAPRLHASPDIVKTGPPPVQEMVGGERENQRHNAPVENLSPGHAKIMCEVDSGPSATAQITNQSSVEPMTVSSQASLPQPTAKATRLKDIKQSNYQRQISSPESFPSRPSPPQAFYVQYSNVSNAQFGNNNKMYIYSSGSSERKRHPTAPSIVSSTQR
ncbi:PREDICTED: receptor-interacting serine/threonine-protein kinase 3-like isoform X1 [Cyprinodon variegatus]|uniref:Receptor-interacting serine/threonine-protein kinase 3-like n=1 Tax=Cyprinodon variegatus TaxID=28743 RepID=A0A3Q2D495_CYPVA|nr:PREDICTED: receptor-interacting serine/threonine-protein kinase 3-like isoform X1 [Cyprinodon variegatus]